MKYIINTLTCRKDTWASKLNGQGTKNKPSLLYAVIDLIRKDSASPKKVLDYKLLK